MRTDDRRDSSGETHERPPSEPSGSGRLAGPAALDRCTGGATLHVEPDNPARRLYERIGFSSKYVDMRWSPS